MDLLLHGMLLLSANFLTKILHCSGKTAFFRRNYCLDDVHITSNKVVNNTESIALCAAVCNTKENCKSFFFHSKDARCMPLEGEIDVTMPILSQNGWEFYNSVNLSNRTCNTTGFHDSFTEHKKMFHSGEDIRWYYTVGATLDDKIKECEQSCLSDPTCRGYEMSVTDGVCSIEAINKWDKDLEPHPGFIYYNRNYDCGCPPSQMDGIHVCYTSSMDGSNVTYICPKSERKLTYTCTPHGWGVADNQISC